MVKPKASSTPKIVDICSRRRIGDTNYDSIQSPIANYRRRQNGTQENITVSSNSEEESSEESDDYIDSSNKTGNTEEQEIVSDVGNKTLCNCVSPSYFALLVIAVSLIALLSGYSEEQNFINPISAKDLAKEFPSQVEDFWIYIEEGIQEVKKFHKPKTFVFLYNDESRETLSNIINRITEFVTCTLTYCTALPVTLEASDLSSTDILNDYGEIITRNKANLEESGVMVVKNLEKVPGIAAQAFHSLCDEYNPVVKNAIIIFTMKVDKFRDNNLKFIEKVLYNHWKDIEDDKFYPLFTRIVNVVLPIMAEK